MSSRYFRVILIALALLCLGCFCHAFESGRTAWELVWGFLTLFCMLFAAIEKDL